MNPSGIAFLLLLAAFATPVASADGMIAAGVALGQSKTCVSFLGSDHVDLNSSQCVWPGDGMPTGQDSEVAVSATVGPFTTCLGLGGPGHVAICTPCLGCRVPIRIGILA